MAIKYAKSTKLSNDTYLMHCPMAFKNKGADWLQNSKDVINPYYGDKMLTCGSTKETIAKAD